jgi:Double-GTPase 2
MYAVMRDGVRRFSLGAKESADDAHLVRAAGAVRNGEYPPPSDQRAIFELVLRYKGTDVFPFSWRDYRGGALSEKSDIPQARELHEDLKQADGIVVFCDSLKLLTDPRGGREVRSMVTHVLRALDARGRQVTPLVLVLTKTDLVDYGDKKVQERLEAPFLPLIRAISAADHVHGALVPVACGPRPVNVDKPVLWTLRFGIEARAQQLQASIAAHTAAAQSHKAKDTLWNRFSSWATDETPQWRLAEQQLQAATAESQRHKPLVVPARRLGKVIKGVRTF